MQEPDLSKYGAVELTDDELSNYGAIPFNDQMQSPDQNSYLQSALRSLKQSPESGLNFILGAGDALVNFPKSIANMITPESMQVPLSQSGEGLPYDVGNVAGELATFLGGGGALNEARLAATRLPYLGKIAESLSGGGLPGIARRGMGSGLYGAIENPENRGEGAALGGGLSVALDSLLKGSSKLFPSNLFRGQLTAEELKRNLDVTQGTQTGLGDVIESPFLKRQYENVLAHIPFSGVDDAMSKTANTIVSKGENIVNKYLGNTSPLEVDHKIGEGLIKAFDAHKIEKNSLYDDANILADELGVKIDPLTFINTAREYKKLINNQEFLKFEPESKSLLSRLTNYATNPKLKHSAVDLKTYIEKPNISLQEANILAGELNSLSKKYNASPISHDRNTANILSDLGKSLKSDIRESINNSGNKILESEYIKAEKNYAEKFSPFLDKDIYKFIGGEKSPEELVSNFIKTGINTDKGDQIKKLMSKLSPEDQNLVKYSYLSRAMKGEEDARTVGPLALKNLWGENKLGIKQKQSLFSDKKERKELDNYSKLVSMNTDALNRMFNPGTGKRAIEALLPNMLGHSTGAVMGYEYGGFPGAIAGGILGTAGTGLGARYIAKKLNSPKFRENIVNKIIKKESGINKQDLLADVLKSYFINR